MPKTRIWGLRVLARPTEHFQLGLYRAALWGGVGQDNGAGEFWRILTGGNALDNPQDSGSVAGSQLAGVDLRWHWFDGARTWAFYVNGGFRDETHYLPKKFFPLFGIDSAWAGADDASERVFLEYSDTTAGRPFTDGIPINDTYENPGQYKSGYRYYGKTMGYPTGNNSRVATAGWVKVNGDDQSLSVVLRAGVINWDGTNAPPPDGNPIALVRIPLVSADAQWALLLGPGMLTVDTGATAGHPSGETRQYHLQAWPGYQVTVP